MSEWLVLVAVLCAFGTSVYGYIKARVATRVIREATRQVREATRQVREANDALESFLKNSGGAA